MSDTCNAARKTKRLLADLIGRQAEAAYKLEHGEQVWESMTENERESEQRVYHKCINWIATTICVTSGLGICQGSKYVCRFVLLPVLVVELHDS